MLDVSTFMLSKPSELAKSIVQRDMADNSLRMHPSHFMLLWREVTWNPLASASVKLGWSNSST